MMISKKDKKKQFNYNIFFINLYGEGVRKAGAEVGG